MNNQKDCIAMILAGGQGSRLGVLTQQQAKPAVPFGGKYRIIDFPLSNCTNSGIEVVGILTQYEPFILNSYIGNGAPWDLNTNNGGVYCLQPSTHVGDKGSWYAGTADAIYQNIRFIERYSPDSIMVLSGDHIYKMDYKKMLRAHRANNADATIAVMPVPIEEANRYGILTIGDDGRVVDFTEKPEKPSSNLASMGIYVFDWKKIRRYIKYDATDTSSKHDFGKDVIPAMLDSCERLFAYRFEGYWRDVGTINSLWEANMDLLDERSGFDLSDNSWKILSRSPNLPAAHFGTGALLDTSMVAEGCDIEGEIVHSLLFQGVTVKAGARVADSVVMRGAIIEPGAVVERAIIAENVRVGANAQIGASGAELCIVGADTWIASETHIAPGQSIEPNALIE